MILNGKNYKMRELTFNSICKLEDMGISLTSLDKKPLATIRAFIGLAVGDLDKAGKELEAHIKNGGTLEDIMQDITDSVNNSGFFQALAANRAKKIPASKKKTTV